ncbi:thermonuclease family protein [Nocardia cyriacigeorgica]|uniref:Thermonuclease family protein n=1 Tax=Nocardia cyriacigeorgica TaxID=135487 RepID=A0A5R8P0H7_9NOCA|nr:thermonuclease family protein [Nocardia cyriacigeorgica]TLF81172.1 thermonuclease family protein [Nocardia cyriacigeorgica]
MAGRAKLVAAVAGVSALVGIGIGVAPDPEPERTATVQSTAPTTPGPAASSPPPVDETEAVTSAGAPTGRTDIAAPAQVPGDTQQAVVRRIVDGDTLEVAAVAAGPVLTSADAVHVRLLEINSPETKDPDQSAQCYGPEATAELTRLAPPGSTVWVQRDRELLDRYDRHLLYLWNAEGEFVNLAMVQSGHAEAVLYPPNDKHWPTIGAAQSTARSASVGAWSACPVFGRPEPEASAPPVPSAPPLPNPPPVPNPPPAPSAPPPPPVAPFVPDPEPVPTQDPPVQSGLPSQRLGPDTDCSDYPGPVIVAPGDPHRLDGDGDGIGCDGN